MKLHPLFIAALALCLGYTNASWATGRAYITNQGSNNVSVIDVVNNKVITTIEVGKAPVGVAVSTKLAKVFISNVDGQSISVIDSKKKQKIKKIKIKN